MSSDPYRLFSDSDEPPPSSDEERARIFGLETEYAVLFLPDRDDDASSDKSHAETDTADARPSFRDIEAVIFALLLEERCAANSSGTKGGYFLENGGLVHLEILLRHEDDSAILEIATPECRSPWDVLVYGRAFDSLLDTISRRSRLALRDLGYRGRLAFGKNNIDSHGVGYGSHENYLVRTTCTSRQKTLYFLAIPFILLTVLPAILVAVLSLFVFCGALVLAKLIPPLERVLVSFYRRAKLRGWNERAMQAYSVTAHVFVFPAVALYSALLRRVAFREFTTNLTPFVVSRQILTGAGFLDFEDGVYEISQRPCLTRSLQSVIMFGRRKTIFDLKSLLFEPLALFRPTKKFTIAAGDSNLSDVPALLKLATTALVIEMIESGETFDDLEIVKPVRALRDVSRGGPWKELTLARPLGGKRALHGESTITSVALQREYLARAKAYFSQRPAGKLRAQAVLELWEETLEALANRPQSAEPRIDWLAKKAVLDQAIRRHSDWKAFFAWGRILHVAGLEAATNASGFDDLVRRAPWLRRAKLHRLARADDIELEQFAVHRELYFQARKIDLRYHEISDGEGYQRTLESEGFIERLTVDEDVERATKEAPRDTRARIRGYYISLCRDTNSLHVNWNEIEMLSPLRHISLPDPFYHRLPGD